MTVAVLEHSMAFRRDNYFAIRVVLFLIAILFFATAY